MAVAVEVHRWTQKEYERMAAEGLFSPDARVELIDGIVYDRTQQNGPHASAVHRGLKVLEKAFPDHYIRVQSPLALTEDGEPEPDLAVVPGAIDDYDESHPSTALLVVEVADHSLSHDRSVKIPLYARSGIPEAWLQNLKRKTLEVYRDPMDGIYQTKLVLRMGDTVSPLAMPGAQIPVADLFFWKRQG
jgi:Uma2 family endonuclease